MQALEPERKPRSIPAHLAGYFLNGEALGNTFDETLARAVESAFKPGRIREALDARPFHARLKLAGVDFEGDCVQVIVAEKY